MKAVLTNQMSDGNPVIFFTLPLIPSHSAIGGQAREGKPITSPLWERARSKIPPKAGSEWHKSLLAG